MPVSSQRVLQMDMMPILVLILFALTLPASRSDITGYDPSELLSKIFNSDDSQARGYGLVYDQGQGYPNGEYTNPGLYADGFQGIKKKRRRRPKKTMQNVGGFINNGESFYNRPVPRPSLAAQALSSITDALTSIAKYDDYQCVPRLLCEASGGMGAQALPTVPGLESLMTLLSAYTGITTSPLFVFGRAVYLGVSSHGNPASCRYAYPQCPTDAEKLVHYLNNHNGGFFRFFNSPQQQQNLDQFYQNYQQYDQNLQPNPYPQSNLHPNPQSAGQYGFYKPNLYENQQEYGSAYNYNRYKTGNIQKRIQNRPTSNAVDDGVDDTKWKFPEGSRDFDDDSFYTDEEANNFKFPESNKNDRKTRGFVFPSNLNRKPKYDEPNNNKFVFFNKNNVYGDRGEYQYDRYKEQKKYQTYNKYVKEQDDYQKYVLDDNNYNYNQKYVLNDHDYNYNNQKYVLNDNNYNYNNQKYVLNDNNYNNNNQKYVLNDNNYNKEAVYNNYNKYEDLQTVYVVRGNGDPNRPEIVKLRPGQSVKDV